MVLLQVARNLLLLLSGTQGLKDLALAIRSRSRDIPGRRAAPLGGVRVLTTHSWIRFFDIGHKGAIQVIAARLGLGLHETVVACGGGHRARMLRWAP